MGNKVSVFIRSLPLIIAASVAIIRALMGDEIGMAIIEGFIAMFASVYLFYSVWNKRTPNGQWWIGSVLSRFGKLLIDLSGQKVDQATKPDMSTADTLNEFARFVWDNNLGSVSREGDLFFYKYKKTALVMLDSEGFHIRKSQNSYTKRGITNLSYVASRIKPQQENIDYLYDAAQRDADNAAKELLKTERAKMDAELQAAQRRNNAPRTYQQGNQQPQAAYSNGNGNNGNQGGNNRRRS